MWGTEEQWARPFLVQLGDLGRRLSLPLPCPCKQTLTHTLLRQREQSNEKHEDTTPFPCYDLRLTETGMHWGQMSTIFYFCLISGLSRPPPSQRLLHHLTSFTKLSRQKSRARPTTSEICFRLSPSAWGSSQVTLEMKQHKQSQCPRVTGGLQSLPTYATFLTGT